MCAADEAESVGRGGEAPKSMPGTNVTVGVVAPTLLHDYHRQDERLRTRYCFTAWPQVVSMPGYLDRIAAPTPLG